MCDRKYFVFFLNFILCLISELYNYAEFFEKILHRVCKNLLKQNVTVVEFKQIFGMVFDEDGFLSLERELAIFERVQT